MYTVLNYLYSACQLLSVLSFTLKDWFADSEEAICSYCVFGSVNDPKYVAAITDRDMECKVSCDATASPQCSCYNKYDAILF